MSEEMNEVEVKIYDSRRPSERCRYESRRKTSDR